MRNREAKCRSSRLQVYDENLMPCFEILFASIAITHLPIFPAPCRNQIERVARAEVSLNDTLEELKSTLNNVPRNTRRGEADA
jgi:hypothetical protein